MVASACASPFRLAPVTVVAPAPPDGRHGPRRAEAPGFPGVSADVSLLGVLLLGLVAFGVVGLDLLGLVAFGVVCFDLLGFVALGVVGLDFLCLVLEFL